MAGRIRTLKPEWLEDEILCSMVDSDRLLSVALILLADDYGNGRASPIQVAATVWGGSLSGDPAEILRRATGGLARLAAMGFISLYEVRKQQYFSITNWSKHQLVKHPSKPRVPSPDDPEAEPTPPILPGPSGEPPESLRPDHGHDPDPDPDQRPATVDARARAREGIATTTRPQLVDEAWSAGHRRYVSAKAAYSRAIHAAGGVYAGDDRVPFAAVGALGSDVAERVGKSLEAVLEGWATTYVRERSSRRPDWWLERVQVWAAGSAASRSAAPDDELLPWRILSDNELSERTWAHVDALWQAHVAEHRCDPEGETLEAMKRAGARHAEQCQREHVAQHEAELARRAS